MTVSSETIIEEDGFSIDKLESSKEEEPWHVLRYSYGDGERISIPFDTVEAGGAIISLKYRGTFSASIAHPLTGTNKYKDEAEMPESIVNQLQEIGPW